MIYNVRQIGSNRLRINEEIPVNNFILAVLYVPCNNNSTDINGDKKAILTPLNCSSYFTIDFFGVTSFYEDLLNGEIYFSNLGTWTANLYYQESQTNEDINQATFLETIELQVV